MHRDEDPIPCRLGPTASLDRSLEEFSAQWDVKIAIALERDGHLDDHRRSPLQNCHLGI